MLWFCFSPVISLFSFLFFLHSFLSTLLPTHNNAATSGRNKHDRLSHTNIKGSHGGVHDRLSQTVIEDFRRGMFVLVLVCQSEKRERRERSEII